MKLEDRAGMITALFFVEIKKHSASYADIITLI